jgi:adenylate cyclase
MADAAPRRRRLLDAVLAIGAYPAETEVQRGARRVMIVVVIAATVLTIPNMLAALAEGQTWVAVEQLVGVLLAPVVLIAIGLRPRWFVPLISVMFAFVFLSGLIESTVMGGLLASGLSVMFGLLVVLGALIAVGLRAAMWWTAAFIASVVYALVVPRFVDPIYSLADPGGQAAFNLIATALVVLGAIAYFVRQRDRFQRRSDDLLHNILPDEVAARLKDGGGLIAEDVESASVLFADVVGFTPMSASMQPAELVGLLNELFTRFDGHVAALGLEKIKTVGDEYMAASGVPRPRPDHAHAIAELALRIRDDVTAHAIRGQRLSLRIGINSGPLTAGIVGTHKFAYDLWGDTVNTASRMESEGIPGEIQVSPSTYELIRDDYECDARGAIPVKGKGEMATYLLRSRREVPDVARA